MKNLRISALVACVCAFGVFAQSCTTEEAKMTIIEMVDSRTVGMIALAYLQLEDNQYVLSLSKEEAYSLGISKYYFERIQTEIRQTNVAILELQEKGIQIDLPNPKHVHAAVVYASQLEKYGEMPIAKMSTSGQPVEVCRIQMDINHFTGMFQGICSSFLPAGVSRVYVTVSTLCVLVSVATGSVNTGGAVVHWSGFAWFGSVTVPVDVLMNNVNMTVMAKSGCRLAAFLHVGFNYSGRFF